MKFGKKTMFWLINKTWYYFTIIYIVELNQIIYNFKLITTIWIYQITGLILIIF